MFACFTYILTDPIVAVDANTAGTALIDQPLMLQCTATIVRDITSTVDIIWITDNTLVRRVNNVTASSYINPSSVYNDSFIIPSLDISDIGSVYECEVLVNSVLPTSAKADIAILIPSTYVCLCITYRLYNFNVKFYLIMKDCLVNDIFRYMHTLQLKDNFLKCRTYVHTYHIASYFSEFLIFANDIKRYLKFRYYFFCDTNPMGSITKMLK